MEHEENNGRPAEAAAEASGEDMADLAREGVVAPEFDGSRLDAALAGLFPELSLRGRRRLFDLGEVQVFGRPRAMAHKVRAGDRLAFVPRDQPAAHDGPVFAPDDIPILADDGRYAALAKPGGLHSAALPGPGPGGGPSLEALLPSLFPGRPAILLSRLDRLTSGIVPLAFGQEALTRYQELEEAGEVAKTYLAVVRGRITAGFTIKAALDTDNRIRTRVLARDSDDPLRLTRVTPLTRQASADLTLVEVVIAKGARHQIRAHLASRGHPLVGDPLYGGGEGNVLFLHHAGLASPVLSVDCPAPWSLGEAAGAVSRSDRAAGDES